MEKAFWEERWNAQDTGWDLGAVSPPLKAYIDQLSDTNQRILIPGCGNAYEAEYLLGKGFGHTHVVEIAAQAIASFRKRVPGFPPDQIHHTDFFKLDGTFDLIFEQTFFCAIQPEKRPDYARKMAGLLAEKGQLVGLLFDTTFEGGPPFGGSAEEYRTYFEPYFDFEVFETAYNSIPPRQGRELFIRLVKK